MTEQLLKSGKIELAVSDPGNILIRDGKLMGRDVRRVRVRAEDVVNWEETVPPPEEENDGIITEQ